MERREKRFASRILAWFLTFLMITTMIPTSAFAALPAQDTGAVVSEDASSDETTQDGILLKTTLTDKLKVKGQRKLFDVWARDAEDNTLKPTATLDGQALSATWSDNVKTSFTLDFQGMEEGEHTVVISAEDGKGPRQATVLHPQSTPLPMPQTRWPASPGRSRTRRTNGTEKRSVYPLPP